jgi:tetratricopeptide (TPR) repeat protein
MKTTFPIASMILAAVCFLAAGCDTPPAAPKATTSDNVNALTVRPNDNEEVRGAMALETARVSYQHRLEMLRSYYERVGDADKYQAAGNELKTLRQAQAFRYQDLPDILPPERESLENADERLLVEYVVQARNAYLAAVDQLLATYDKEGNTYRLEFVRSIKKRFDPIRVYMYFPAAEIPGPNLRPTEVIREADELYARALRLFHEGKGLIHTFATTDYRQERQALLLFMDLIQKYPTSNKIALSAYYIGDIYKEYFNEDTRAVMWYERAWQWDPQISEPARFQAGTVYDLRLRNPEKAVECYNGAIKYEQFNSSNVRFARKRVQELTGQ